MEPPWAMFSFPMNKAFTSWGFGSWMMLSSPCSFWPMSHAELFLTRSVSLSVLSLSRESQHGLSFLHWEEASSHEVIALKVCYGFSEMTFPPGFCLRLGMEIKLGGEGWKTGKVKYKSWALCLTIWLNNLWGTGESILPDTDPGRWEVRWHAQGCTAKGWQTWNSALALCKYHI